MKKQLFGNIFAGALALAAGAATIWVTVSYLKQPDGLLDWLVLILSGLTTATIIFFIIWGHFQDDPLPNA